MNSLQKKISKKKWTIFALITIIFLWSLMIYYISPQKIIDTIGLTNGYGVVFLLAIIGGTSLFIPIPYFLVVGTFAIAGLNPFILGICAGIGIFIGDSTSYYIAYRSRELTSKNISRTFEKIHNWCVNKNSLLFPILIGLYAAIVPLPDDIIIVPAGLIKYPFWRIAVPLLIGKIIFNTVIALTALYGWSLFIK